MSRDIEFEICVCRYNENISWLEPLAEFCNIYNKNNITDFNTNKFKQIKQLENVGRETDTILNYIIYNYYDLPNVVLFTQGGIEDHKNVVCPNKNPLNFFVELYRQAKDTGYSHNIAVIHNSESYINYDFRLPEYNNTKLRVSDYSFGEWFEKELDIKFPKLFYVYWHSIFAVRKDFIQKRPIEFYQNLLKYVNDTNAPEEAHYFERSWYYIFNPAARKFSISSTS